MKLCPVILAGGIGERLHPVSTLKNPKFLLRINSRKPLIAEAFSRAKSLASPSRIYVITTRDLKEKVVDALYGEGFIPSNLIEEPERKNTLPAFVLSALNAPDEAILCFMPSDHIISPLSSFKRSILNALSLAEDGFLTMIGVKPSHPNTHYGYIVKGERCGKGYIVRKFVEKPSLKKAKALVKSGGMWNSGIYVVRKEVLLELTERFAPDVINALKGTRLIRGAYAKIPPLQFDRAITEKTERKAVVEGNFRWMDIGSFEAVVDYIKKSNAVISFGNVELKNSKRIIAISLKGKLYGEGLCDMIIINNEDMVEIKPLKRWRGYGKG